MIWEQKIWIVFSIVQLLEVTVVSELPWMLFTPSYYLDYPAHDEGIDHSKWSILWCGENCDFDRPYYSERICDLSDTLLRMQIRRKHAPHIMKLLKEELGRRKK